MYGKDNGYCYGYALMLLGVKMVWLDARMVGSNVTMLSCLPPLRVKAQKKKRSVAVEFHIIRYPRRKKFC